MKPLNSETKSYFRCKDPSHNNCELSTLCLCPTCPQRGLICYLCTFTKPHIEHSPHDIVPLKLINRGKSTDAHHNIVSELEKELKSNQDAHLKHLQEIKKDILQAFEKYEKQIDDGFQVLRNEIFMEEDDLLEKLEKKACKDEEDLQQTVDAVLKNLVRKQSLNSRGANKWFYEEATLKSSQLEANVRGYLLSVQFQYKVTKEHLMALITEKFHFPLLDLNIEDYLKQVLLRTANTVDLDSFASTCRTSDKSEDQSDFGLFEKICGTPSAEGKSPRKIDDPSDDVKKPRSRLMTFGKYQYMEEERLNELEKAQEKYKDEIEETQEENNESRDGSALKSKTTLQIRKENIEKKRLKKYEESHMHGGLKSSDIPEDSCSEPEDYTIIKDNETESEFANAMIESDIRFIMPKDQGQVQRIFKKPVERFDAVSFYSKTKDITLEGFGFYVPLPCEGDYVSLEYRVYEGTQKEAKEIMREELNFECDVASVKESAVMERILLKMPVTLEKKKWYTIVLCYLNEVKMTEETLKWKDVGPFVFLGVEIRQAKDWLGIKTIETEKMYCSQFPYLIYSEI